MNGRLLIENNSVVRLALTTDAGAPITTAAVSMVLEDREGNQVSGQGWPTALVLDNGVYVGGLQDTLVLREGEPYFLNIRATAGGLKYHQRLRREAAYRT